MTYSSNLDNRIIKFLIDENLSVDEGAEISAKIVESGAEKVFIDLKKCFYLQSKALANLVAFKKAAVNAGAEISLVNVAEEVFQVLEMTNLLPHFIIDEDFSSFTADELLELFFDAEKADKASEYMSLNYSDEFKEKLYAAIDFDDPLLQEYAVNTIGRAHDFDAIEKIQTCLVDHTPGVSRAAILALGWLGDIDSKETIYGYLNSEFKEVAEAAAASIALLSDESDTSRIKELTASDSPETRSAAIKALSLINDQESFEIIKSLIDGEENENVKVQMVKGLSGFNRPGVAEILLGLFDDKFLKVREAAASGIVRIKAKDKANDILARVDDDDAWVGYFATKALSAIGDDTCASGLIDKYEQVEDNVKLAIIEALGHIGQENTDMLIGLLEDSNEDIRKEALSSLYIKDKDAAVEQAVALFENDSSWLVRFKALEIIGSEKPEGYKELFKSRMEKETNKYIKDKIYSILDVL